LQLTLDICVDVIECVACGKTFKSEKAFACHENSKKHKEAVKQLKAELLLDEDLEESLLDGSLTPADSLDNCFDELTSAAADLKLDTVEDVTHELIVENTKNDIGLPLETEGELDSSPNVSLATDTSAGSTQKKRRRAPKDKSKTSAPVIACNVCAESFSSRTKLFDHIKESGHAAQGPKGRSARKGKKI
jgi:DnaJ homolog subfamily A member 5